MKRKIGDVMIQSAIRLPQDLRQRLQQAAGERWGMNEEIRRRLEASFEAERAPTNAKTQELLDAIAYVADATTDYYGSWSEDAFAFDVLKASVELLLAASRPKGEAVPKADPNPSPDASGFANLFFDPDSKPQDIARIFLGEWRHARPKHPDHGKRR